MPKVSVIIPAYNVERYIPQSILSVLAQTFGDYELLVIDDGSKDATALVTMTFTDPRVRLVQQANRGLAGARNGGIRAAKGEYLAFLDADDLWHPEKLARHVAHLDANPHIGVSYSASAFIDDDAQPLNYGQYPKLSPITARDVFLRNPVGNGSAPVIRRATLDAIAFPAPTGAEGELWYFDERFRQSEDIECWTRIALSTAWGFEGLGLPLTLYRVNSGGLSANVERQLESWERMVRNATAIDPAFVQRYASEARGYQFRYLSRRAVRSGQGALALTLLARGLRSHPGMLLHEPGRTLVTVVAALVRLAVPESLYQRLERLGMRWANRGRGTTAAPAAALPHIS